jgi:hypothetical protein
MALRWHPQIALEEFHAGGSWWCGAKFCLDIIPSPKKIKDHLETHLETIVKSREFPHHWDPKNEMFNIRGMGFIWIHQL